MAKAAVKKLWRLPVLNGRVRCLVTVRFGHFRAGKRYGFTPSEIEAELVKREPRFLPDNGEIGEAESLLGIDGMTSVDQKFLHDRGVLTPGAVAGDGRDERAGIQAFFQVDRREESRRRKLVRLFRERVVAEGLDVAQKAKTLGKKAVDALKKLAAKKASDDRKTAK